jgi:hypothetical protein
MKSQSFFSRIVDDKQRVFLSIFQKTGDPKAIIYVEAKIQTDVEDDFETLLSCNSL